MAVDVTSTLKRAVADLESERDRVTKQIAALRDVLRTTGNDGPARPARRRTAMSAAARRAVSQRMKAYWAKRRAEKKGKSKAKVPAKAVKGKA